MEITQQTSQQLATLVNDTLARIKQEKEELITDFHITTNAENGEVTICDDNDNVLACTTVEGYEEADEAEFRQLVGKVIKKELETLNKAKAFDSLNIFRPFSFVLVDADYETIEDLLVVDDDTIMVSDELLKGLDEELDEFIKKLLQ